MALSLSPDLSSLIRNQIIYLRMVHIIKVKIDIEFRVGSVMPSEPELSIVRPVFTCCILLLMDVSYPLYILHLFVNE